MEQSNLIPFPGTTKKAVKKCRVKNVDGIKYFNELQIKSLRRKARDESELDISKNRVTAVKEWLVIDLLTSTGLRVSEAANLCCADIKAAYNESAVYVRNGKGNVSRTVQIPESLKKHLKQFITWKQTREESIDKDAPLFIGQRGQWTSQAVQQVVKKYLKLLGLYENGKSVHALRHSYAVEYYRRNHDLRGLQKQLGHSSIQTTQIYADITNEDIQDNIKNLWGGVSNPNLYSKMSF